MMRKLNKSFEFLQIAGRLFVPLNNFLQKNGQEKSKKESCQENC
jgi:hypothetical protein